MKYLLLVILFAIMPIGKKSNQFDKKVITLERRILIIEQRIIEIENLHG